MVLCYTYIGDKMLKEYLNKKNISVYKLAQDSNVPYTTLNELVNGKKTVNDCKIKTIENIAKSLNISIETLLDIINNKNIYLSNTWEETKSKIYYFPIVITNPNYECNRIHPLKQKIVNDIYNICKKSNIIEKVIIFGSSVNIRCNIKSDLDIAIKLKDEHFNRDNQNDISELIQEITEYNSDIVWLNTLDENSRLFDNIYKKGVIIYE